MHLPRSPISLGALEAIRDHLRNRKQTTVKDLARDLYADIVSWADPDKDRRNFSSYKKNARQWAHSHLQHLNRKDAHGHRVVEFKEGVYSLA